MKQIILLLAFGMVWLANPISAQTTNVGIGTTNPAEKLDVNGNINLNGTIKVNGQDGQAGQVLMKNSSGQLSWGSISEFKNFRVFTFTFTSATQTFSIPAGVTRMGAEIWSGGGGGAAGGGGGSGGYAYRILDVSGGGSLSIIVGGGGQGAFPPTAAVAGGLSQLTYGSNNFAVSGGNGASTSFPGFGGSLFTYSGNLDILSQQGQTGRKNQLSYQQYSATEFVLYTRYGNGGLAPFQPATGGEGGQSFVSTTTGFTLNESFGAQGYGYGEGGGGGLTNGYPGAAGRVVVWW